MTGLFKYIVVLTFVIAMIACAQNQDPTTVNTASTVTESKIYSKENIAFSLPKDWNVRLERYLLIHRTIAIDTTGLSTVTIEIRENKDKNPSAEQELESSINDFAKYYKKCQARLVNWELIKLRPAQRRPLEWDCMDCERLAI